jgi:hypothetical protein
VVCSAQIVQQSCIKLSTISKRTELSLHLSLVTMEYHWVCPKQFLSPWNVWCKPCTYLAPTLTLSPNRPKRDSTWPMSPRSYIACIQNDFWACCTFGEKHAPILHQDLHYLQTDWIELPLEPRHHGVSLGASKTISKPMVCFLQTVHLSCTDTNTVSKQTKMRFHMTQVT